MRFNLGSFLSRRRVQRTTRHSNRLLAILAERRGSMMVEFAIVGPIFFLFLFVIFEVAYDAYVQSVLDTALQATARQVQVGSAQTVTAGASTTDVTRQQLISNFMVPNSLNFLSAGSTYVRVERIDPNVCTGASGAKDIYDATNGKVPVVNGQLQITNYGGTGGTAGDPTACATASSSSGYCVPGPSVSGTPEFIIMNAVYVTPSFLGGLVGNTVKYNSKYVRALFSTAAFVSEGFASTYVTSGSTPAC